MHFRTHFGDNTYMDIKGIRNVPTIQGEQTQNQPTQEPAVGGISNTPDLLEASQPDSSFTPDSNDEVVVQFQNGDMREPEVIGNLWNETDPPPATANPYTKDATKQIATFLFSDSDSRLEALQNSIQFANVSGADPAGDIFSFMLEYQKMMNKEAQEDKKIATASQGLSEASMEFLIGLAGKLSKSDQENQLDHLSGMLDQLKQAKQDFQDKLAQGTAEPVSQTQLSHFLNWASIHKWPPD